MKDLDHQLSSNFLARFVARLHTVCQALPALLNDCLSAEAGADSPTSRSTSSCRGDTNLHMVGKVPGILGSKHVQPCLMTACYQLPVATDELILSVVFATQRSDFPCCRNVHCSHLVVLLTSQSLCEYLHPCALRCAILSATTTASTFRLFLSPKMSWFCQPRHLFNQPSQSTKPWTPSQPRQQDGLVDSANHINNWPNGLCALPKPGLVSYLDFHLGLGLRV